MGLIIVISCRPTVCQLKIKQLSIHNLSCLLDDMKKIHPSVDTNIQTHIQLPKESDLDFEHNYLLRN